MIQTNAGKKYKNQEIIKDESVEVLSAFGCNQFGCYFLINISNIIVSILSIGSQNVANSIRKLQSALAS